MQRVFSVENKLEVKKEVSYVSLDQHKTQKVGQTGRINVKSHF